MADTHRADAAPPPQPRTIYRENYSPPDWRVETVDLDFDLGLSETRVTSRYAMIRLADRDTPIRLDVDGSWPEAVRIDGNEASWERAGKGDEALVIAVPKGAPSVLLEIETRLAPDKNTQLMGLYASNAMLCTQCESEGFRRIVPFVDRPDNLSVYTVRMAGDKAAFPVLLSNGSCTEKGDLADGRHFAVWHDPWPKPSYLFACVAGDLVAKTDRFTTMSGKHVNLSVWVRRDDEGGNAELARTGHAMASLKRAMEWDERVYGREYDLPEFHIVAVADFNMGAMENKSLNIFNTRYVLADPETATDMDYDGVEGVVGHEYFHNWSGNRVTCRDWFQLSLKEGFTVFRDQSFSADMGSPTVKRIEDVRVLRAAQFPEDSGPLAHPVRPDSYQEISNFYTATVYNKGAEVIRMMATQMGPERFRAGTDLYFDRHDGEAATCEDFVAAMEQGGGIDFTQFRRWYEQGGTPRVTADLAESDGEWTLALTQTVPATPGQPDKQPMPIPLVVKAFDRDANADTAREQLVVLDEASVSVPLGRFARRPALSFNRGFSAPVTTQIDRAEGELAWLAAHDDDGFARYEALQDLMVQTLVARIRGEQADLAPVIAAIANTLDSADTDPAFVAEAILLPGEAYLGDQLDVVDPDAIRSARRAAAGEIGRALEAPLRDAHRDGATDAADLSPLAKGRRRLRGLALGYLLSAEADGADALAFEQFENARGMTDRQSALVALANSHSPLREKALDAFHARYRDNPLVLDKWFSVQAAAQRDDTVEAVQRLAGHPDFKLSNPNRVRSLYGAFAGNQAAFHRADGAGYRLVADLIIALDPFNPQTAARLVPPLGRWSRYDDKRAALMRAELERIASQPNCSRDVAEQAAKSLG